LRRVCIRPQTGSPTDPITMESPLVIEVEFWNQVPGAHLNITLRLFTGQGIEAFVTGSVHEPAWGGRSFPRGRFRSMCFVPGNLLNSGMYRLRLAIVKDQKYVVYRHEDALMFEVMDSVAARGAWYGPRAGAVHPKLEWTTEYLDNGT
jgi:lipopolysaccharide transport system ATP-binding protein